MDKQLLHKSLEKIASIGAIANIAFTASPMLELGAHKKSYSKMFALKPQQSFKSDAMKLQRFSGTGSRTFF